MEIPLAVVTGSAGFIGSAVVRQLLLAGRSVRAVVQPGTSAAALDEVEAEVGRKAERVEADVCDRAGMRVALQGATTLFHLAAVYKTWAPDPTLIFRVNLEGTTNTLLLAQELGLSKVVYTSSIAAIGLASNGRPADESTAYNLFDVQNDYIQSKWLSERIALRFAEAGLPLVVVNPAFPFGPRDKAPTPTGKIVLALLKGQVPGVTPGGFNCIHVDDVALGHVLAEQHGKVGERYILGDHNVTLRELFGLIAELANVPEPKLRLPGLVAEAFGLGFEMWADYVSHEEPRATLKSIQYAQREAFFDVRKARNDLGLPTRPLHITLMEAINYFRTSGMLT